jgi:hypothetical protein
MRFHGIIFVGVVVRVERSGRIVTVDASSIPSHSVQDATLGNPVIACKAGRQQSLKPSEVAHLHQADDIGHFHVDHMKGVEGLAVLLT